MSAQALLCAKQTRIAVAGCRLVASVTLSIQGLLFVKEIRIAMAGRHVRKDEDAIGCPTD
jgi:hypothetical protein